jgi:hypothetical protein
VADPLLFLLLWFILAEVPGSGIARKSHWKSYRGEAAIWVILRRSEGSLLMGAIYMAAKVPNGYNGIVRVRPRPILEGDISLSSSAMLHVEG